jgi:hypothetical protein
MRLTLIKGFTGAPRVPPDADEFRPYARTEPRPDALARRMRAAPWGQGCEVTRSAA